MDLVLRRDPGSERARQRLVAVHHRLRPDARLRRHAHRQFRPRIALHGGRLHRRDPGAVAARMWFGPVSFWVGILVSALIVGLHRRHHRGAAAAAHLWRARAVPAARDLRRRARACRTSSFRSSARRISSGPRAPGLRAPVEILGRRFPSYELVLIAAGPAGARARLASAAQDPLRRAGARRDAGSRHGGGARRQSGAAVHRHAVSRRLPGRARRRAADPARRRQYGHGSVDHRRMLRRHRRRRHGQRAGRLSRRADHRPAAGLRHSDLPEDHARGGVPADGRGAGGAALRFVRPARDRSAAPTRSGIASRRPIALTADALRACGGVARPRRCCRWSAMPTC